MNAVCYDKLIGEGLAFEHAGKKRGLPGLDCVRSCRPRWPRSSTAAEGLQHIFPRLNLIAFEIAAREPAR